MIYKKKHKFMKVLDRVFLLLLSGILIFFCGRVGEGRIPPDRQAGTLYRLAEEYEMGEVCDRNGNFIVTKKEQEACSTLFGPELQSTYASRMTLYGMAPELFGVGDDRLHLKSLVNFLEKRKGGNVTLTIDKDLQAYLYELLWKKGFRDSAVVVSNWNTGEILASVSLPGFLSGQDAVISNVLGKHYSVGSTMKPILAAAALTIDPELKDFVYDCKDANHDFHTDQGVYHIACAGNVEHGRVNMEEAMACSCNGYFISLLQQVPRKQLEEVLKDWGFDTVVRYDQFSYWDHTFAHEVEGVDYLLAAIGQGNSRMTPMGLHLCISTLLNGGMLEEPRFIKAKSTRPDQDMEDQILPKSHKICEKEVADQVCSMMLGVTEHGTGKPFFLPGFAAKTGTAQKEEKQFNTVWTTGGLTDLSTPYAITVCLDQVGTNVSSVEAGKIGKEILEYLLK